MLARAVEQLRDISLLVDAAQNAAVNGHIMHALRNLDDADRALEHLGPFQTTRAVGVLRHKQEDLKKAIIETVSDSWNGLILVDHTEHRISLKQSIERDTTVDVNDVIEALKQLGLLDNFITRLSRDLDQVIVFPRFELGTDHIVAAFDIEGDDIRRAGTVNDGSVKATLEDVHRLAEYLSSTLR